jgi:transcriptional regulator with XRE-family HTH domain
VDQDTGGKQASTHVLGRRLRSARLALSMTQSEVANKAFSISYISAVERGQITPSLRALERLAARLQVSVLDLLREDSSGPFSNATKKRSSSTIPTETAQERLREARILTLQSKYEEALSILLSAPNRTQLAW